MYRRRRRVPIPLIGALGVILGLAAAGAISIPRATDFDPAPGESAAPAAATVTIAFSQDMRRETVEARFSVEPARSGTFRWEGRRMSFTPAEPWDEGQQVSVGLASGGTSLRGLPMLVGARWNFTVGAAHVAYLWPAGGPADLYLWSPVGGAPTRLTETPEGVIDFRPTSNGSALVYSARVDGTSEIRLLDPDDGLDEVLYRCPGGVTCRNAALSPDGRLLAFEQHEPKEGEQALWRVWVLPLTGGAPFLPAVEDHPTSQPAWSSLGWLVVYDHTLAAYLVYDQVEPERARMAFAVPNGLGEPVAWSPDGGHFVFPEIVFLPEPEAEDSDRPPEFYSHLRRVSVVDGTSLDVSGSDDFLVEDTGPAYSPDGRWIAFARRGLAPRTWTPGRQAWRARPDGAEPFQLTDAPSLNHAALSWSPDGTRLAYMVFDQLDPTAPAEMWWRRLDGSDGGQIAVPESEVPSGGYGPVWIP